MGTQGSITFPAVHEAHSVIVAFSAAPPIFWPLHTEAGTGGSIAPGGDSQVPDGQDVTVTWAADSGFVVASVTVDGVDRSDLV